MWFEKLVELKKRSGKTLNDIATDSGVPLGTLNKLFAGQTSDPKLGTVRAVVHALGYTLDDLDSSYHPDKLTYQEKQIALAYRQAHDDDRAAVELILRKYMEPKQEKTVSAG